MYEAAQALDLLYTISDTLGGIREQLHRIADRLEAAHTESQRQRTPRCYHCGHEIWAGVAHCCPTPSLPSEGRGVEQSE